MTTSTNNRKQFQPAFVPKTALARAVRCDDTALIVSLLDGRELRAPLVWFPILIAATPEQRARCEIGGGGVNLYWPEIDEDLSVAGLLAEGDQTSM